MRRAQHPITVILIFLSTMMTAPPIKVKALDDDGTVPMTNTALATSLLRAPLCVQNKVIFLVAEAFQGQDLNADGDELDLILHIHDQATNSTVNTGLVTHYLPMISVQEHGPWMAFHADEDHFLDLNGDGDTRDFVIHLYNLQTGQMINTGLSSSDSTQLNSALYFVRNLLFFAVDEDAQGQTDLNGDGDGADKVLHRFNLETKTITNSGIASNLHSADHYGPYFYFLVEESGQQIDFNDDGDQNDSVLHRAHLGTQQWDNLKYAVPSPRIFRNNQQYFQASQSGCAFHVSEFDQGETDLNGDLDINDDVTHFLPHQASIDTGLQAKNLALASDFLLVSDYDMFAIRVPEWLQGRASLNNDLDSQDVVLHIYDAKRDQVFNLELALDHSDQVNVAIAQEQVFFVVDESMQGRSDLNGDLDRNDAVIHWWDRRQQQVINSQRAGDLDQIKDGHLLFHADEAEDQTDFNRDGDFVDLVLHHMDLNSQSIRNIEIASTPFELVLVGDVIVGIVHEQRQGNQDFTGDRDFNDTVLFWHDLSRNATQISNHDCYVHTLASDQNIAAVACDEDGRQDFNGNGKFHDFVIHSFDFSVFAD